MNNQRYLNKTSFEKNLEFALHAYGFSLTNSKCEQKGIIQNEYISTLISNTKYEKSEFKILRSREIKEERFKLTYEIIAQDQKKDLYEILSIWLPPPNKFFMLPNYELIIKINHWYIDSLEIQKEKQIYDAKKMVSRTLSALQLHKKIDLPKQKIANPIEIK